MSLNNAPAILADTGTVENKKVTHRYRRRFVIRTIKNGQVKIHGRTYKPSARWMEYNGCLDGMRYVFGLYWTGNELEPFVSLWGSEKVYRGWEECDEAHSRLPEVVYSEEPQNWYSPWVWWYTVNVDKNQQDTRSR